MTDADHAALRTPGGPVVLAGRSGTPHAARAWDAADQLLLDALGATLPTVVEDDLAALLPDRSVLSQRPVIAEERHGALTAAWRPSPTSVVVDSLSSERAARSNLRTNGGDPGTVEWRSPLDPPPGPIDLLVVRPGRDLARFGLLLDLLASQLSPDAVVLGASMVHHLHRSTLALMEAAIGPTRTTRAHRRARLMVARRRPTRRPPPTPGSVTDHGITVVGWPGVFGATAVDPATRLLLDTLDPPAGTRRAVDLCCGTAVLAVAIARAAEDADVLAIDDAATAVDSAIRTIDANRCSDRVRAVRADVLDLREGEIPTGSVDLVVCNPPFHDERAVSDEVAWRCILTSRRILRRGGELRLVAHRRLGHHTRVRRVFGDCEVVASDRRFVVLSARTR